MITEKVVHGLYPGVSTVDLDNLAAEIASSLTTKHPDYGILAARIAISNLHKETKDVFSGNLCIHPWMLSSHRCKQMGKMTANMYMMRYYTSLHGFINYREQ